MNTTAQITFLVSVPDQTPSTDRIFMAGSVTNGQADHPDFCLTKQEDGRYRLDVAFPKAQLYEYRFTRGSWESEEVYADGQPRPNRLLDWDGKVATIECSIENWKDTSERVRPNGGDVRLIEGFEMPQLGRTRTLRIYLPPDYESSEKRYPVLYMHDGQNIFESKPGFDGVSWGVDVILDGLFKANLSTGIIVVGVDNGAEERSLEYSPWELVFPSFRENEGKGDHYADFLVHTLKPWVDTKYRTLPEREHTAISGSSMGGLISLYTGIKYQEVFSKIAALSSFVFRDGSNNVAQLRQFITETGSQYPMRIYMDIGGKEIVGDWQGEEAIQCNREVFNAFVEAGFDEHNLKFVVDQPAQHNESAWNARFREIVLWLFA